MNPLHPIIEADRRNEAPLPGLRSYPIKKDPHLEDLEGFDDHFEECMDYEEFDEGLDEEYEMDPDFID